MKLQLLLGTTYTYTVQTQKELIGLGSKKGRQKKLHNGPHNGPSHLNKERNSLIKLLISQKHTHRHRCRKNLKGGGG